MECQALNKQKNCFYFLLFHFLQLNAIKKMLCVYKLYVCFNKKYYFITSVSAMLLLLLLDWIDAMKQYWTRKMICWLYCCCCCCHALATCIDMAKKGRLSSGIASFIVLRFSITAPVRFSFYLVDVFCIHYLTTMLLLHPFRLSMGGEDWFSLSLFACFFRFLSCLDFLTRLVVWFVCVVLYWWWWCCCCYLSAMPNVAVPVESMRHDSAEPEL